MRRVMLCAGVLSFIAATGVSSQSYEQRPYCPVGSSACSGTYFEYVLAAGSALTFGAFWDGYQRSNRRMIKRAALGAVPVLPGIALHTGGGGGSHEGSRSEAANHRLGDDRSSESTRGEASDNDSRRASALYTWDWLEGFGGWTWTWGHNDFARGSSDDDEQTRDAKNEGGSDKSEARRSGGDDDDDSRRKESKPDVSAPEGPDANLAPEPSTLLLFGAGVPMAVVFIRGRRRR